MDEIAKIVADRNESRRHFDSFSIEMKETPTGEKWAVYGWGIYPPSSVLAGQTSKTFIEYFDSETEASIAYPGAEHGYRSANNTYSHLPGEDDPVSGGMYPDDIDDGE
jgi:hypothetical protein